LAQPVGTDGTVLATDIDPSWVGGVAPDGVEVRRHDVAQDDPPEGGFDLVHARLVLMHVPDRGEAMRRMAAALRPGGHLLIEDFDVDLQPLACPDATGPEHERAERIRAGFIALLVTRGVDRRFAGRCPRRCAPWASPTCGPTRTSRSPTRRRRLWRRRTSRRSAMV
jgi:SAM-dependent methyltransferase